MGILIEGREGRGREERGGEERGGEGGRGVCVSDGVDGS